MTRQLPDDLRVTFPIRSLPAPWRQAKAEAAVRALSVSCDNCHAAVGQPCWSASMGREKTWPHGVRRTAAKAAS